MHQFLPLLPLFTTMNPFQLMIAVLAAAAAAATSTSSPKTAVTTPGLMTEWPSDKWPTSTFSTAVPGPTSIKDDYYEKTDLADVSICSSERTTNHPWRSN